MKKISNFKFQISNSIRGFTQHHFLVSKIGLMVKSGAGFTLVELLIYMGIMTILLGVLTQVFTSILDTQLESEATSSADQDSRYILSRLTFDILRAETIVLPANLGDLGTTLQLTINSVSYSYALNNGNLQITDNLGTEVLNSVGTQISNLSFQRVGNPSGKNTVQISFRTTSVTTVNATPEVRDVVTTVGVR